MKKEITFFILATTTLFGGGVISNYSGTNVVVTIPGIINGTNVVGIAAMAFKEKAVVEVHVAASITNVGAEAFADCTSLIGVYWYGNAPIVDDGVYTGTAAVTNYVVDPRATGWSDEFGSRPVVRLNALPISGVSGLELALTNHAAQLANLPTYPAVTNYVDSAIAPYATAVAAGGWAITNWWEPVITPVYSLTAPATQQRTNSYLISRVDNASSGFVDYLLDYQSLEGWSYPPTWTITSGSQYAYIASNRVWATTQGVIRVAGTSSDVTRTVTLPINYGSIANPIVRPSHILPGSSAAAVADPIIYMASNYIANTVEPLVPRPNAWNTNETWRTNYAAVISAAWNIDCWLTNAPALFAPTSYSGGWGATLISPTVFVSSRHVYLAVGSTRSWLTPAGAITSAVIARVVSPFPDAGMSTIDLQFGVIDRPMPTNMIAYVATHAQLAAAFPAPDLYVAEHIPAVAFNQHLDASLVEIAVASRNVTFSTPRLLATSPYSELFHAAHPGDSSRPIILPWGDKPVLLALYYYAYYGSSISSQIETIASVVAAEGETLQYIDFTEAP